MTHAITAIFCTLCMAAGWFYLARSRGVERLAMLESARRNATRRKARRLGAWSMILVGLGSFWLMFELDREPTNPLRFLLSLVLLFVSLATMIICALVDMYLTRRMHQTNRGKK